MPALEAWTLARIRETGDGSAESLAERLQVDPARVSAATSALRHRGLIAPENGWFAVTRAGGEPVERPLRPR